MLVDILAYRSSWRFVHPGEKLTLFLVLTLWGFLPLPWVHLGLLGLFPFLFLWSGIPPCFFIRLLRMPLFSIGSGILVVMFSSRGNFAEGLRLALRSAVLVSAFLFFASTTPIPDLLGFFQKFRFLRAFSDIALLVYRYLFVFSEKAQKIYCAEQARLGYGSYRRSMQSLALLAGSLFLNTFQILEWLHRALEARGFDGELAVLSPKFKPLGIGRLVFLCGVGGSGLLMAFWGRYGL